MTKIDKKLFSVMYNFVQKRKGLTQLWLFIANASTLLFFVIYGIVALYVLWSQREKFLPYILIPSAVYFMNKTLRALIGRPRPEVSPKSTFSCPSNHAASAGIISIAVCWVFGPWGALAVVLAFITGLSRVFIGVHYPFDVLLGWLLAALFGLLFILV